jgi:hypothetical protein
VLCQAVSAHDGLPLSFFISSATLVAVVATASKPITKKANLKKHPTNPTQRQQTKQAFEAEAAAAEAQGQPWAKEKWYGTVHKLERISEVIKVCL